MARGPRKPTADPASVAAVAGSTPSPPANLQVATLTWAKDKPFHRIHLDQYAAGQFNPGLKGNARFSPIRNAEGEAIPTLYGGETFECAAMETVFHDVPFAPGHKSYDKGRLQGQVHSQLVTEGELVLADLRSKALRKLGIPRKQLIDTEKDQYPATRRWAEAIHAQHPEVQGLCWTSRQDDSAQAFMLFGDRVSEDTLRQTGSSRGLIDDDAAYAELLDLAEQIGVDIVPGKA